MKSSLKLAKLPRFSIYPQVFRIENPPLYVEHEEIGQFKIPRQICMINIMIYKICSFFVSLPCIQFHWRENSKKFLIQLQKSNRIEIKFNALIDILYIFWIILNLSSENNFFNWLFYWAICVMKSIFEVIICLFK